MLFWTKQQLDGLPHDPAFSLKGRYGRVGEGGGVRQRLQAMQAAQRFIDEGNAFARCTEEELVIVSVKVSVEGGQLGWRQIGVVRWFIMLVLNAISLVVLSHQLVTTE